MGYWSAGCGIYSLILENRPIDIALSVIQGAASTYVHHVIDSVATQLKFEKEHLCVEMVHSVVSSLSLSSFLLGQRQCLFPIVFGLLLPPTSRFIRPATDILRKVNEDSGHPLAAMISFCQKEIFSYFLLFFGIRQISKLIGRADFCPSLPKRYWILPILLLLNTPLLYLHEEEEVL